MGTPIVMTEVNQLQNVSVCGLHTNNACHMVASFRTTILVPCPLFESFQLSWGFGTSELIVLITVMSQ